MKYSSDLDQNVKEMVDVDSAKFLNNLTNTSTSDSQNFYSSQKISIEQQSDNKNDMPTFGI